MPNVGHLCKDVRRLTLSTPDEQRGWMQVHLQPYRVEPLDGSTTVMVLELPLVPAPFLARTR